MKKIILSILGSILLTSFIIGFAIYLATDHVELLAITFIIILLIVFYLLIKWALDELDI